MDIDTLQCNQCNTFFPTAFMWEVGHTAIRIGGKVFCSNSCACRFANISVHQLLMPFVKDPHVSEDGGPLI